MMITHSLAGDRTHRRGRARRHVLALSALVVGTVGGALPTTPAHAATDSAVYLDSLGSSWSNSSYGTTLDMASTNPARSGTAIAAQITGEWGAVSFATSDPITVTPTSSLRVSLHGGATGASLHVFVGNSNFSTVSKLVPVTVAANSWFHVVVTPTQLGNPATFSRIGIGSLDGQPARFAVDDLIVTSSNTSWWTQGTPPPPPGTGGPIVTTPPAPGPAPAPAPSPVAPGPTGPSTGSITVGGNLRAFSSRFKGTNASSYEKAWTFESSTLRARTNGVFGSMRFPGGQHSQYMGWASCELQVDYPGAEPCGIPSNAGFARVSDFMKLVIATNTPEVVVTLNINVTAKENAALAAFMNGDVNDTRVIGVDQKGADWRTVGYWAAKRVEHGVSRPLNVIFWEFGNETHGGDIGPSKCDVGWEIVYSCDPVDILNGLGSGSARFDGLIATRALIKSFFPSALMGAAIPDPIHARWSKTFAPYARDLIANGVGVIDFLVVHEYMINAPITDDMMRAFPQNHWAEVQQRLHQYMDLYGGGARIPMYMSEYGLIPVLNNDHENRTNWALNGLIMTDSVGQIEKLGYIGASQFNLFSTGQGPNANRYFGMLRNDGSMSRSPMYWGSWMWSKFASQLAATTSTFNPVSQLSVYGGRNADGSMTLLVLNKSESAHTARVNLSNSVSQVRADVASAPSPSDWDMTFNGNANPRDDLSDAPPSVRTVNASNFDWTFPAVSMTLLRMA